MTITSKARNATIFAVVAALGGPLACSDARGGAESDEPTSETPEVTAAAPSDDPTADQSEAEGSGAQTSPEILRLHMGEHFWQLSDAQTAALAGDLTALREAARWLADHDPIEGLSSDVSALVDALREQAAAAADADDLATAALSMGGIAGACGDCHLATGNVLPTLIDQAIGAADDLQGQMSIHIRGADLMWEGLIAPSDEAWSAGAALLETARVLPSDIAADAPQAVGDLLAELRTLASEAPTASREERPEIYGRLATTCGSCHAALGRGFNPGS